MKTTVYNISGQSVGEVELQPELFGVKVKPALVHEVFVAQTNNQREPWANAKKRGEVSGGGKKPWKQKGTGRARHGSIRSPIWKGGGVAFGPLSERTYKTKINKEARRVATLMCLSDKAEHKAVFVIDNYSFAEPKTKLFNTLITKLPKGFNSFLVLADKEHGSLFRMTRNLPQVETKQAKDVSVIDLLSSQALVVSSAALAELKERFSSSN